MITGTRIAMRSRPVYCGRRCRRNSPHARTDDTQLFPQHRQFGFELVDSGVWRITVLDQRFAACEHRDPHNADHLEYCAADEHVPVPGQAQGLGLFFTDFVRHGDDPKSPNIPDSRWPHVMWRT